MSKDDGEWIAGKTFSTPGPDDQPDPELVAHALAVFAEYDRKRAESPEDIPPPVTLPERFHDDMVGTEYEPWYRELQAERARKRQQDNESGE